jgi:hypothetical protein
MTKIIHASAPLDVSEVTRCWDREADVIVAGFGIAHGMGLLERHVARRRELLRAAGG